VERLSGWWGEGGNSFSSYKALTLTATAVAGCEWEKQHRDVAEAAGGEQELPNPTNIWRPSLLCGGRYS